MRVVWLAWVLAACSPAPPAVAPIAIDIQATGLTDVAAVEILVLDGDHIDCARVLRPEEPLDDGQLDVVAHTLVTAGASATLGNLPLGVALVFYGESYGAAPPRKRNGRGCAQAVVEPGAEITLVLMTSGS